GQTAEKEQTTRVWLEKHIKDEKRIHAARRHLIEDGLAEDRVAHSPPEQVLLLDEVREFEARRDDAMKLMNLPTWQVESLLAQTKPKQEPVLFDFLVPALNKVRRAQGRLEQRIALLRHVEAIRM